MTIIRADRAFSFVAFVTAALFVSVPVAAARPSDAIATNATGINVQLPAARVSISGKIVQASNNAALTGVTVRALNASTLALVASVTTGGVGRYHLVDLPNGSYKILVLPQTATGLMHGFYSAGAPGHFAPKATDATALHYSGTTLSGTNLALPFGLTLSGTVRRSSDNAPVADVVVRATPAGTAPSAVTIRESAVTDGSGNYVIHGLTPAHYIVGLDPQHTGQNLELGCYNAASANQFTLDCASATSVQVTANVSGINASLPAGLIVSGHVKDRSGNDLCAHVVARGVTVTISGSVDACGAFSVSALVPGDYNILVTPVQDAPVAFEAGSYTASNSFHWADRSTAPSAVSLAANTDLGNVRPKLGHVVSGFILKSNNDPIVGVEVSIVDGAGATAGKGTTGGDGSFSIGGIPTGTYTVLERPASHDNFQTGWLTTGTNGFTAQKAQALQVSVSGDIHGITIHVPAGFTISGKIKNPNGQGIAAELSASGPASLPERSAFGAPDGTYTIQGLDPGSYIVSVRPGGAVLGVKLEAGYYRSGAPGSFTKTKTSATPVAVGP